MGAPVDLAMLAEVTDGDPEFAQQLIDAYIGSSNQSLQEMQLATQNDDRVGLSKAAHKLKGASANIYAVLVRELAAAIENQAADVPTEELQVMIASIAEEIERAQQHLLTAVAAAAPPLGSRA
jgi:HPt (histidine-containing phosphotransfer) domain-containing protein